jgi:hypothetical protein
VTDIEPQFEAYHKPMRRARQFFTKARELTALGEHGKSESVFRLAQGEWNKAQEAKKYFLKEGFTLETILSKHTEEGLP